LKNLLSKNAINPPLELALAAIRVTLATHAGHMTKLFLS